MAELTRELVIERTRAFLREELLEDPAAALPADEGLISGGVVTSFDLVSLSVFLEKAFGVTVPDSKVNREYLDTLERIAALVLELRGESRSPDREGGEESRARDPITRALPSFRRRAPVVALAIVALVAGVDRWVAGVMADPARVTFLDGARADKPPRRVNYAYQDYAHVLARHELGMRPKAPGEVRVVFQGDSGTFGSYLEAEEACPAVAERLLQEKDPGVHVYNVSYYGQTFVKDAEILEAALPYKPDVVVISLGSVHLNRQVLSDWWLRTRSTMVYNGPLFREFLSRAEPRPELAELGQVIASAERLHQLPWLHRAEKYSALMRYQLLLRGYVANRLTPACLGQVYRAGAKFFDGRTCRVYAGKTAQDFPPTQHELDERALVLLEAIVDRARASGALVLLFREPEPFLEGKPARRIPWRDEDWAPIERAIQDFARRKNVPLVDQRDALKQDEFLDSERHWTPEGNARLGKAIAEGLAPLVAKVRAARR